MVSNKHRRKWVEEFKTDLDELKTVTTDLKELAISNEFKEITQIGDFQEFSFANGNSVNTQKEIIFPAPANIREYHLFLFHNPSTETDLTVKIFNTVTVGGQTRVFVDSFIVPAKNTVTGTNLETDMRNKFGELFMLGGDVVLVISNNQVIGGSGGFTGRVGMFSL